MRPVAGSGSLEASRPKRSHAAHPNPSQPPGEWVFTRCGWLLPAGAIVPGDEVTCGNCRRSLKRP